VERERGHGPGFILFPGGGTEAGKVRSLLDGMGFGVVYAGSIEEGIEAAGRGVYAGIVFLRGWDGEERETVRGILDSGALEWLIAFADDSFKERVLGEIQSDSFTLLGTPVNVNEFRLLVENISEVHSLRRVVSDTERRVSHLELINRIASEALKTRDENTFLWKVAHIIHENLSYFNVNIFLVDGENVVLRAFAGGFGDDLVAGYSLGMGEGITGWVAQNREPLLVGDVRKDPRRIQGFSFEENVLSELGVPIIADDRVLGVLHVESEEPDAFDRDDVITLETVADQMALAFENQRLSKELLEAYELSSTVNDSLPVSIILVDEELRVRYVNRTFCEIADIDKADISNRRVTDFFSKELAGRLNLEEQLRGVMESGETVCHTNIHHTSPHHPDKILNITLAKVQAGKHPRAMILIQDVTDFTTKTRQLSLIREISIAMQGVFERDKLLNMILTSVTAGFAMGFNRAFLFLVDSERNTLEGTMGVGPTSRDEAYRIWDDLSRRAFTFEDYLRDVESGAIVRSGLQDLVENMSFDMAASSNILIDTVRSRRPIHILDAWENPGTDEEMKKLLVSNEFVTMPLIAKNEVIGVIFADNAYSGHPITGESIEELAMFAAAAALAIENSHMVQVLENQVKELEEAYRKLEETHKMLVRHEKLAAIGEMSTRLAHEIRNPLTTIGGFAKSITRKYDDRERTIRSANIIIEEVRRLENILTNVLDFTKTGVPQKELRDINGLVRETVRMMEGSAAGKGIVISLELSEERLEAAIDPSQMKQVLINLIQNAFNAMEEGGALGIRTSRSGDNVRIEIRDTGTGIPEEFLECVFDPFFTTRHGGTGLGLSISQRIVQNHDGALNIESEEGVGTTIEILLPAGGQSG